MDHRTAIKSTSLAGAQLLAALKAFRQGDFSVRLPIDLTGLDGEIADAFNDVVELNERMTQEIERLGHIVGKQGKVGHRAKLPNATGSWATNVDMVNDLIGDMAQPTGEMARVIDAAAKGDLSQRMNLEIEGRALRGEVALCHKPLVCEVDPCWNRRCLIWRSIHATRCRATARSRLRSSASSATTILSVTITRLLAHPLTCSV